MKLTIAFLQLLPEGSIEQNQRKGLEYLSRTATDIRLFSTELPTGKESAVRVSPVCRKRERKMPALSGQYGGNDRIAAIMCYTMGAWNKLRAER